MAKINININEINIRLKNYNYKFNKVINFNLKKTVVEFINKYEIFFI
jgi:hypothetical protein